MRSINVSPPTTVHGSASVRAWSFVGLTVLVLVGDEPVDARVKSHDVKDRRDRVGLDILLVVCLGESLESTR